MDVLVTQATGTAEREAALRMVARLKGRRRRRLTLALTKRMTPPTSSGTVASSGSPRTSPNTPAGDAAPSTAAPSRTSATS
jgi:hypothetical protein